MKNIAVFNDLSSFGKCSLTAAIPVLSVLGSSCHPIATAVLTGQSGYKYHYCEDLSKMLPEYEKNWSKNQVELDAIYTGYLLNPSQFTIVESFIRHFRKENTFFLVDPVMGDQGRPYSIFSDALLKKMKEFCNQADMITPNLTEACLLSGINFHFLEIIQDTETLLTSVTKIADQLHRELKHHPDVIITGVLPNEEKPSHVYMVAASHTSNFIKKFDFYEKGYSGTGDLFASIMCGLKMKNFSLERSMEIAGDFLSHSIANTIKENIDSNDGIHFETQLKELFDAIQ